MTEEQKDKLKETILRELNIVDNYIRELTEFCKPIAPECALGDLARFELMHDQSSYEKRLHEAKRRKTRLQYALSRIDTEDFCECEECGEEIPFARLELMPESRLCINCAHQTKR